MATPKSYEQKMVDSVTATIADGQTTTPAISLYGCSLASILFPTDASFTGVSIVLNGSYDGANFFPINDQNLTPLGFTLTGKYQQLISLSPWITYPYRYITIQANTAQSGSTADFILGLYPI